VLGELHRFLGGEKATLLWDGLPAHRSRAMQAFVASQRRWLVVERLPAYAPELNPVEALWANLKARAVSWPTSPATPSTRSPWLPLGAPTGYGKPRTCRTRSFAAAACPCGEQHRTQAPQRWQVDRADRPARRSPIHASTSGLATAGMSKWPVCW
jgi:hypothetical protein